MKKVISFLLVICLCMALVACGGSSEIIEETKSPEAQKADEMILAIGEVTADSEDAILKAQEYYDSLTPQQQAEVENYALLETAQEQLPQKKLEALHAQALELMEQGDYISASTIVYEHPEFSDYEELVQECGRKILPQYVKQQGEEKDAGKYFVKLETEDDDTISLWYMEKTDALQFVYYSSGYGLEEGIMMDYTLSGDQMIYMRTTTQLGTEINSQSGRVSVTEFTGTYQGSNVENSKDPLVIPGLTIISYKTVYDSQTRGYHIASMNNIGEMLEAAHKAVIEAGYKGTLQDIGFKAYKTDLPQEEVAAEAVVSTEAFDAIKNLILTQGVKKEGVVNYSFTYNSQKYVCPLTFVYAEEENEIWVQAIHMQEFNVYYQVTLYISAENNTVSFETQHATLDSASPTGIRIIKGNGVFERQGMTALMPVTFTQVTDNTDKGAPEKYEAVFNNRIHAVLATVNEFMQKGEVGTLKDLGFTSYIPVIAVGDMTFELN